MSTIIDDYWMKFGATVALPSMLVTFAGGLLGFGLTFWVGMCGVFVGICIGIFGLIMDMWSD